MAQWLIKEFAKLTKVTVRTFTQFFSITALPIDCRCIAYRKKKVGFPSLQSCPIPPPSGQIRLQGLQVSRLRISEAYI